MDKKIIKKKDLARLLPLLEAGFPGVSLADEEEYFAEAAPDDWVICEKDGEPAGFVRHFPDRENGFSSVDYYFAPLVPAVEAAAVLREYCAVSAPEENIRLALPMSKSAFIEACSPVLPVQRRFLYYEKSISGPAMPPKSTRAPARAEASRIADIMASMGNYTASIVEGWIKDDLCYCHVSEGEVVGACYIHRFPAEAEIEMITVLPEHRGKGHGRAFMEELFSLLYEQGHGKIFLKVAESNKAAVSLYRAVGMAFDPDKSEVWLSRR